MRVLGRKDFLKLPEGTIYADGAEWFFNNLRVKGETLEPEENYMGNWIQLNMAWPEIIEDSSEAFVTLEKSLETGSSFEGNTAYMRNGCFNEEDLFLVFEKEDLLRLKEYVEEALKL